MLEAAIERKVCEWAKKNGWLSRKLSWVGRHSAPDRFFAKGRRVVLIEFKQKGKTPTPNQKREIDELRAHGVETWVADTVEDGIGILSRSHNRFPWEEDDFI